MGGKFSEEFIAISNLADNEEKELEIAHIFKLGDTYSQLFELIDNNKNTIQMACYGIGISRLLMLLLEKQLDNKGFYGTKNFHTFEYIISSIDFQKNQEVKEKTIEIYQQLKQNGKTVLLDDRNISAGKKLSDSELICAQKRIIISKQNLTSNNIELLTRETNHKSFLSIEELKNKISSID